MSVPSPTSPSPGPAASAEAIAPVRRQWFRPRVVLLLLGLTAVITASVIAVDVFSPRDRHGDLATPTHPSTTSRGADAPVSSHNGVTP